MGSEEEIHSIYQTLSKDGEIKMELQDTFWGARYAVETDQFGLTGEKNLNKGQE